MVRYFCGECFEDHDNARDCPHYSKVGKSYEEGQKVANNMKKRGKMKNNNYADPNNAPQGIFDNCFTVLVLFFVLPACLVMWGVIEWIA